MQHRKKIWPQFFRAVVEGSKGFELRVEKPGEAQFMPGDTIILEEFDPRENEGYTGASIMVHVDYVLRNEEWLQPGVCCMSIRLATKAIFAPLVDAAHKVVEAEKMVCEGKMLTAGEWSVAVGDLEQGLKTAGVYKP